MRSRSFIPPLPAWIVFPAILAALTASHLTLLRLPYYWDEAGYYIPAAWDFFRTGSLIPLTTPSNAHPPLPSLLGETAFREVLAKLRDAHPGQEALWQELEKCLIYP